MADIRDFLDEYMSGDEGVQTAANLFGRYVLPSFGSKDITDKNVEQIIPRSVQDDLYRAATRAQAGRGQEINLRKRNLTEKEDVYRKFPTARAKQDLDLARGLVEQLSDPNVSAVQYEDYDKAISPKIEDIARRSTLGQFYATKNPDGSVRIQDKYDFNKVNADTLIQSSNPLAQLQGYAQKASEFVESPMGKMMNAGAAVNPLGFLSNIVKNIAQPYDVDFTVRAPEAVQREAIRAPQQTAAPVRQTRIQEGETLTSVAARLGTDVQTLARLNKIQNPDIVAAGQTIVGPGQANPIAPAKSTQPEGGFNPAVSAREFTQGVSRAAEPVMRSVRDVASRVAGQEARIAPILARVAQANRASQEARATKKPFELGISEFLGGLFKGR
jgi:LysM repeat protein